MAVMSNVCIMRLLVQLLCFLYLGLRLIICRKENNTIQFLLINYHCNVCNVFVRLDSSPRSLYLYR